MTSEERSLVSTASVDEVITAIESIDLEAPWPAVAPSLRIAMPRRRPLPPGVDDLPLREYPPGIRAGLGLDIGPAMLFVSQGQLDKWGVSSGQAFDQALANVRARVAGRSHFVLIHEPIAGVPTTAFQSREGWASSLLLLPPELTRVFGARDGLILAPMRDLLLLMPLETDPELALDILELFADEDMNALDLALFALVGGRLTLAIGAGPDRSEEVRPMH